jgi:hypothetical protein
MADFLGKALDDFLHKNPEVAKEMLKRIQQSERERKEIADIKKLANQRAKAANIHNKKLRDCRFHLNEKGPKKPGPGQHHLYHRGRLGQRLAHQGPRRGTRPCSACAASRSTATA